MDDKIEITENAQNHIAKVISQDKANYFRISVQGGGCAGFNINLILIIIKMMMIYCLKQKKYLL